MALEIRYLKRGAPRVKSSGTQAKLARRKLLFFHGSAEETEAVLDISSSGMKLLARGTPLKKGDRLQVEVAHASLEAPVSVAGIVRWVRPETGENRYSAGIEFQDLPKTTAEKLDRLVAQELGSRIAIGSLFKGYVAHHGKELVVYDADRRETATISDEKVYLLASRERDGEIQTKQGSSLQTLLRWVFDADKEKGTVEVTPPIDVGKGRA